MKKLKLVIKEKGRYVTLPGMQAFRTPAKVDVTKIKISILIQALHSCGVNDYELLSVSNTGETIKTWTKDDITMPNKKQTESNTNEHSDILDKLDGMLLALLSKKESQKDKNSEQITNRLSRIERLLKSGSQFIPHIDTDSNIPIVEEMEDQYIPTIDVSDMQIKGNTTEIVEKTSKEDIDAAVDLLSSLTKNGGK